MAHVHLLPVGADAHGPAVPGDAGGSLDAGRKLYLGEPLAQVLARRLQARIGHLGGAPELRYLPIALDGAGLAEQEARVGKLSAQGCQRLRVGIEYGDRQGIKGEAYPAWGISATRD